MADNVSISDSTIGADFVQGDKNIINEASLTPLESAILRIVNRYGNDEKLIDIFEGLAEYLTEHPERKIIGLKQKLEQGERKDLLEKAIYLKNKFDRKITKKQLSNVVQRVHIQVLASIVTAFDSKIRPLILNGTSTADIDSTIHDHVIMPAYRGITRFNDLSTTEEVSGMLYFLTGKCHIVWSK